MYSISNVNFINTEVKVTLCKKHLLNACVVSLEKLLRQEER